MEQIEHEHVPTAMWDQIMKRPIRATYVDGATRQSTGTDTRKPLTSDESSAGTITRLRYLPTVFNRIDRSFESEILPLCEWSGSTTFNDTDGDNDNDEVRGVNERDAEEFVSVQVLRRAQWFIRGVLGEDVQRGAQALKPQQGSADLALSRLSRPDMEIFFGIQLRFLLTDDVDDEMVEIFATNPHFRMARTLSPDWKTENVGKERLEKELPDLLKANLQAPDDSRFLTTRSAPVRSRRPSPTLLASRESDALYRQSEAVEEARERLEMFKLKKSSLSQPDPLKWQRWGWHHADAEPKGWYELNADEQHVLLIVQQLANELGAVQRRGSVLPFQPLFLASPNRFVPMIQIGSTLIRGKAICDDLAAVARLASILYIMLDRAQRKGRPSPIDADKATGAEILNWIVKAARDENGQERGGKATPSSATSSSPATSPSSATSSSSSGLDASTPRAIDSYDRNNLHGLDHYTTGALDTRPTELAASTSSISSTASSRTSLASSADSFVSSTTDFSATDTESCVITDSSASALPPQFCQGIQSSETTSSQLDTSSFKSAIRAADYVVIQSDEPGLAKLRSLYRRPRASTAVDVDVLIGAPRIDLREVIGCGGTGFVCRDATGLLAVKLVLPFAGDGSDCSLRRVGETFDEVNFLNSQCERMPSCAPSFHGLFTAADSKGTVCMALVFDLVNGSALSEWSEVREHREACLEAIDLLHQARILHNDLRPANFIVQANGTVKIVDYARARSQATPEEIDLERQHFLANMSLTEDEAPSGSPLAKDVVQSAQ